MAKSLTEYIDWLAERPQLLWPKPSAPAPLNAAPFVKPLDGIRAVSWCVYGTLLNIDGGVLHHLHPQDVRMQIALQKTIDEFKMWNSMSRKPGQPWEYMLQQYEKSVQDQRLSATQRKGDTPEVDSVKVWYKLVDRLLRNEYDYDRSFYGLPEDLALKVAFFFHTMLQGVAMSEGSVAALLRLSQAGIRQGLLDDAQAFTLKQLQHALRSDDPTTSLGGLISPECVALSFEFGVRKPSPTLFALAAEQYRRVGIDVGEVLYVSHRLHDDLAIARRHGFRTALFAGDERTCQVEADDLRNPEIKPDRLVTSPLQILEILAI